MPDDQSLQASAREFLEEYFQGTERPLLLSNLGHALRERHVVVPEGVRLLDVAASLNDLVDIVRDPAAPTVIELRKTGSTPIDDAPSSLRDVPRALLRAFGLQPPEGMRVFYSVHTKRYRVAAGEPQGDEVEIESDFRVGHFVESQYAMSDEQRRGLWDKIRRWSEKHSVDALAMRRTSKPNLRTPARHQDPGSASALERLVSAQQPALRQQLLIPLDIALYLARLR